GHMKLSGEVRDRSVGAAELLQHAAPGRVRQRGERSVETGLVILNHMVQYVAERLAACQEETKALGGDDPTSAACAAQLSLHVRFCEPRAGAPQERFLGPWDLSLGASSESCG